jgi:predicted ATPase
MITDLHIKNFKSIADETISLSNVNVFIGENGCGKTNILEAVGFASAAAKDDLSSQTLYSKGIRNAKPSLILNSFLGKKQKDEIELSIKNSAIDAYKYLIVSENMESVFADWKINLRAEADFKTYLIYTPNTLSLRGIQNDSQTEPVGINGENLDVLISSFNVVEMNTLNKYATLIGWLEKIILDESDALKFAGYKPNRSKSRLYFQDKFMSKKNNLFSAENANEGVLHILFYLSLFISNRTPKFFAIDNIETALNPKLCRTMMKAVAELAIEKEKQVLITTHHPAILDGLNLHDDRQRLFVVKRNDEGHTKVERIKVKPDAPENGLKLSEMWMRGYLGAIPTHF